MLTLRSNALAHSTHRCASSRALGAGRAAAAGRQNALRSSHALSRQIGIGRGAAGFAPLRSLNPLRFVASIFGANMASAPVAAERWWTPETVAIVTGGNKGIGYEIAKVFAEQGLTTVLTARNESLGTAAANKLRSETGGNVVFAPLDIADGSSVSGFADWLKTSYGGATILVNNAGIAYKGNTWGADECATTIATNYTGTARVCGALAPLLTDNARIINVCSMAGKLSMVRDEKLRRRFISAAEEGEAAITRLGEEFVAAIRDDTWKQKGWPGSMYGISKLMEQTYTRYLAQQLAGKVSVNACCPGYCATDMSSWRGYKTAAAGADTPAYLALLKDPLHNAFLQERQPLKAWL